MIRSRGASSYVTPYWPEPPAGDRLGPRPLPTNPPGNYHRPDWGISRRLFDLKARYYDAWAWLIRRMK